MMLGEELESGFFLTGLDICFISGKKRRKVDKVHSNEHFPPGGKDQVFPLR